MQHTAGFLNIVKDAKTRVKEIDMAELPERQQSGEPFTLVDVREESEWAAGHAAGAIHLSKGVIERDIERQMPDHGAKLYLYCGGGYRSALAADALQKMGYTDVTSLDGGWSAYQALGLPIEK